MRPRNPMEISTEMLHDDSGTAAFNWISMGIAILLFLVMTKLEGLINYRIGGGFLQP